MNLNAIHFILTYRCTQRCAHCFHFGAPYQDQVATLSQVKRYLNQIGAQPGVNWVFFEGGEPTLYFPLLIDAIRKARANGLHTAVVTNGYWITSIKDTIPWLRQFRDAGLDFMQISCDELHQNTRLEPLQPDIVDVCAKAGIRCQFIGVEVPMPNAEPLEARRGGTIVDGPIVFRGRAVQELTEEQATWLWSSFDECPHENLADPYRLHIDPYGAVMVCQGISIGNLEQASLAEILETYRPEEHPIVGPLLRGGPAALVREMELSHEEGYVDACHLCYKARKMLRRDFTELLMPGALYGMTKKRQHGGRRRGPKRRKSGRRPGPEQTGLGQRNPDRDDERRTERNPERDDERRAERNPERDDERRAERNPERDDERRAERNPERDDERRTERNRDSQVESTDKTPSGVATEASPEAKPDSQSPPAGDQTDSQPE
jgi:hypothetical protein